ncbi:MAG: NAD(P)H-hydrate epimerase [archaeon]
MSECRLKRQPISRLFANPFGATITDRGFATKRSECIRPNSAARRSVWGYQKTKMITEDECFEIWDKIRLDHRVRAHSKIVKQNSVTIAKELQRAGIEVDIPLIIAGALLHDIGRSESHNVEHGYKGGKILRNLGVPEPICKIAERHVGAGISADEAPALGLPGVDFIPETLEEKIVCYADSLIDHDHIVDYELKLSRWITEFGEISGIVNRFILLNQELSKYATSSEMKVEEEWAKKNGMTMADMMENAGSSVAETLVEGMELKGKEVVVLCGPGNNGGDGLVAARYLNKFAKVRVFMFGTPNSEEAAHNLDLLKKGKVEIKEVHYSDELGEVRGDIVIDALIGTGVKGDIRRPASIGIKKINEMNAYTVSIDVPSGVNPDTGAESNLFVKPDLVVCIHRFKKGLVGKYKLGKVVVVDIGLPEKRQVF